MLHDNIALNGTLGIDTGGWVQVWERLQYVSSYSTERLLGCVEQRI